MSPPLYKPKAVEKEEQEEKKKECQGRNKTTLLSGKTEKNQKGKKKILV